MKKFFLIYKIINTQTNKFYIGAHETFDKDDGYMGSGVYLKRAQKKYGINVFIKEILYECSSQQEMYEKEAELVKVHEQSYNIMPGGHGGWSYARSKITSESYEKISATMNTDSYREKTSDQRKKSAERMSEISRNPIFREKAGKTLSEKMNDPEWKSTIGAKRADDISKSVKALHENGAYINRDKKLSEIRTGLKQATINGEKIWVKENDDRINDSNFIWGWDDHPHGWVMKKRDCPHCGVSGGSSVMKRWHFDNCKNKKT